MLDELTSNWYVLFAASEGKETNQRNPNRKKLNAENKLLQFAILLEEKLLKYELLEWM